MVCLRHRSWHHEGFTLFLSVHSCLHCRRGTVTRRDTGHAHRRLRQWHAHGWCCWYHAIRAVFPTNIHTKAIHTPNTLPLVLKRFAAFRAHPLHLRKIRQFYPKQVLTCDSLRYRPCSPVCPPVCPPLLARLLARFRKHLSKGQIGQMTRNLVAQAKTSMNKAFRAFPLRFLAFRDVAGHVFLCVVASLATGARLSLILRGHREGRHHRGASGGALEAPRKRTISTQGARGPLGTQGGRWAAGTGTREMKFQSRGHRGHWDTGDTMDSGDAGDLERSGTGRTRRAPGAGHARNEVSESWALEHRRQQEVLGGKRGIAELGHLGHLGHFGHGVAQAAPVPPGSQGGHRARKKESCRVQAAKPQAAAPVASAKHSWQKPSGRYCCTGPLCPPLLSVFFFFTFATNRCCPEFFFIDKCLNLPFEASYLGIQP